MNIFEEAYSFLCRFCPFILRLVEFFGLAFILFIFVSATHLSSFLNLL